MDAHKNFAYSLVATAPSPASSGTSLVVTGGQGTIFPAVPFNATIWPAGTNPLTTTGEIVTVTAISTDTLTIVRAQESTVARTVIIGDQIAATITARTLQNVEGKLVTTEDTWIQPGYSSYYPMSLEIGSGFIMDVGLAAVLEIG